MRTILIVEDDVGLADVLRTAFRREWNVEMAANAGEAMAMFQQAPPDVVMTDKNMPGMNGLELLRAIRALDAHVGMVVMTAYGTEESARDSFEIGVDAYLEKPFPDLLALVKEMGLLAERVGERRRKTPGAAGALRIFAATTDGARREAIGALFDQGDTVEWFGSVVELERAEKSRGCQLTVVDCGPLGVVPAEAAMALDARRVPCIIIAEGLTVPEITTLIELRVKELVNAPLADAEFGETLRDAITRVRRG